MSCVYIPKNTRRPCANGCGGRTLKFDICHACRDPKRPKRKLTNLEMQHGQGCKLCEGLPWRRPERGKCKCGKRFRPERIERVTVLQRNASIFECASTRV
jgi:hypothetical protein